MAHLVERENNLTENFGSEGAYVPPSRQRMDGLFNILFGVYPKQKYWGFKAASLKERLYDKVQKIAPINSVPLFNEIESAFVYGIDGLESSDLDRFISNANLTFIVSEDASVDAGEVTRALKRDHHFDIISLDESVRLSSLALFETAEHAQAIKSIVTSEVSNFELKHAYLRAASFVAAEMGVGRGNITFSKGLNNSFFEQNIVFSGYKTAVFEQLKSFGFNIKKVDLKDYDCEEDVINAVTGKNISKPKIK